MKRKPKLFSKRELDKSRLIGNMEGINTFIRGYCEILSKKCDAELKGLKKDILNETQRETKIFVLLTLVHVHNELAEMGDNIEPIKIPQKIQQLFPED